ncbi:hypothetical protein KL918_004549 [Ogataea parapolymorpha]|nr:hypothetical protein KL918_004549 [Ogataea parapolymorpha]KAG7873752.1 hypothetical protein KL916_001912 [Ogataea parapolymorpha]
MISLLRSTFERSTFSPSRGSGFSLRNWSMLGITTRSLAGLCRGAEFRYSLSNMDLLVYPGPPTPMWRSVKFSISLRFVSRNADSPASRNRFLPMHAMSGSMS